MALDITQYETPETRLLSEDGLTADGHKYHVRAFDVNEENTGVIPAVGDAFPGLTASSPSHLGPYVRKVTYGPRKVKGGHTVLRVILTGRTLVIRTGSGTDTVEIKGRRAYKTKVYYVYETIWCGASSTDADMPARGDALSNPDFSHTLDALCQEVRLDEQSEPGRCLAFARYRAPILRSEAYV